MGKPRVCVSSSYHVELRLIQIVVLIVYKERIYTRLLRFRLDQYILFLVANLRCCIEKVAKYLTEAIYFINGTSFNFCLYDRFST